ncbi:MAG: type IV pilus secretin PilQ [Magnetococcales bacterium]|nr:type IV pilus secretin PilQ [Magnetococcales bacterium]
MRALPMHPGPARSQMLLIWLALVLGLLSHPVSAQTPPEISTDPAIVQRIESNPTQRGLEFAIVGDRPLHYKIFNLSDPPKLLLVIPHARLSPLVQPVLVETADVAGIFPSLDGHGAVHLEIALKKNLSHDIVADGNRLLITALSQTPVTNKNIQPQALGLDIAIENMQTRIQLQGNGPGPAPKIYALYNPPRIVMDLAGYQGPEVGRTEKINSAEVESAELVAGTDKTRLIVTMRSPAIRYEQVTKHNLPGLVFSQPDHVVHSSPIDQTRVETVNFERDGESAVVRVATSRRETGLVVNRTDADLRLTIANITLPRTLVRRMDVTQFASPIAAIDTYPKGHDAHMVIRLTSPSHLHEIVETPHEILVRVRPVPKVDVNAENKFDYTGKKISMDFKDINIHNALKLIAEVSQLNIILSDTVTGTLTMRLVEVPWDQALDLILSAKGLGKEVQGNVVRIAPMAELQTSAETKRKAMDSQQQLEPFVTELIPVSFANAEDIAALLQEGKSSDKDKRSTRILSEGGAISLDARTSTLIIKDVAANIASIRELIAKLDKPTSQVLIEARIVEISRSVNKDLGIVWGASYKPSAASSIGVSDSAANALEVYNASGAGATLTTAQPAMVNLGLPSATGRIGLHLGTLSPLLDLDIELSALEGVGKAKTISSPRVLTMDNQAASIRQGEKVPYNAESSSGGTTTEFVEAALTLSVTPHVTPNGFIALKVNVTNNSIGGSGSPPPINSREVATQALVRNNETIVLGGIFTKSQNSRSDSVPGLSDLPIIGNILFKNNRDGMTQSELLIFITPRIIQADQS